MEVVIDQTMKKILETLRLKWTEYLLEIFVIVIGILGAYSLNSWNETRKSEIRKDQLLRSLKIEFQYNLNALNTTMGYDSLFDLDIENLLSQMNSEHMNSNMR